VYFYAKKDRKEPRNNPLRLDLGKFLVPNVFLDTKLIDIVANHYDLTTMTMRKMDGMPLLVIKKSFIEKCFGLSIQSIKKIDRENFKNEYKKKKKFGKQREIVHFMYRDHNNKVMYVDHMGPHPMEFFKYKFYAWL